MRIPLLILTRKLAILSFLLVLSECTEIPADRDGHLNSDKKVPFKEYPNYRKKYAPISFCERHPLHEGDSIVILGGEEDYFRKTFGLEKCHAKVSHITISKETGLIAFLSIQENKDPIKTYSISLYYVDSKRGYAEAELLVWGRLPTPEEEEDAIQNLSINVSHEEVEYNLGFNLIQQDL